MFHLPSRFFFASSALAFTLLATATHAENSHPVSQVFASKLQPAVDQQVLAGVVTLVATKDAITHLEAYGYSDLASKRPLKTDDLFWIASMTKPITAAAFLMLVDDGLVSLDDRVSKFIPEFKDLKVAHPDGSLSAPSHEIVIREILSHTSGLRFLNTKDHKVIDTVPLSESINHDLLEPLVFDPGTKYLYSNEGIDTAGRIIELLSKMPYEKFLEERLFKPLKMVDTTFTPTTEQLSRLAKSYHTNAETGALEEIKIPYLTYPLDAPNRYPAPGGGLFSTASDVARFCQMLANGGTFEGKTYLSKKSVGLMTTKQTGEKVADKYGFGLTASDGAVYGHGGAFQTMLNVDHGIISVFLVQHTGKWSHGNPPTEFMTAVRALHLDANHTSTSGTPQTGVPEGAQAR